MKDINCYSEFKFYHEFSFGKSSYKGKDRYQVSLQNGLYTGWSQIKVYDCVMCMKPFI